MQLEIEVKFKINDPAEIIKKLEEIEAKKADEGFEKNLVFDRNGEFERTKKLLRLRFYQNQALITFKEPRPSTRFKLREELNLDVSDFEQAKKLLELLGFGVIHAYEKKRQTFEIGDVGVTVDRMPFLGDFIEIEGSEEGIIETAKKLGLDMDNAITKTYNQLFREYCKEKGMEYCDMVFSKEGK